MLLEKKYAKKHNTRHFLCLAMIFFMLFQSNNSLYFTSSFIQKVTEKKEENQTNKEEKQTEEENKIGKSKKIKRQQIYSLCFSGDLPQISHVLFSFTHLFFNINDLGYLLRIPDLLANLPSYLRFHALVFYEIV
ncbi:MAG: hypothetical protein EAZ97_11545 [Bacteroidetes bacterium]|nr:MAG: hypothetical protein EAZ97_11545 [Bacteroidota bacterium]